ncbi:hypothetical protein FF38_01056 [Lucilia cuprina]|uniref:Uncharacterized protein n=1 Tax=Lucilia cuprina TaxID=7375 RepID=A0A0L0BT91_LUCCU|nr:hypothetical protein FF38_01056 [Lucilia cuprina]
MEELERRFNENFFKSCHNCKCSSTTMLSKSKINLWIILTIFAVLLQINSCHSLEDDDVVDYHDDDDDEKMLMMMKTKIATKNQHHHHY